MKKRIYTPSHLTEKELHGRLLAIGIPSFRRNTDSGFSEDELYTRPTLRYKSKEGVPLSITRNNWPELWAEFMRVYGNYIEECRRDVAKFDKGLESFKKRKGKKPA